MNCTDLILPALTTISAAMSLFVRRVLLQPKIGQRIRDEVERVVGHGRLPRLDDRVKYGEICLLGILSQLSKNSCSQYALHRGKPTRAVTNRNGHSFGFPAFSIERNQNWRL